MPLTLSYPRVCLIPGVLACAFLWYTLVNHLRVEWAVNPQYSYGWAVPFLCAYLLWQRLRQAAESSGRTEARGSVARSPVPQVSELPPVPASQFSAFQLFAFLLLAFLFLPTRLIQEANPEWRLVGWVLALETIGLTLLLLRFHSSMFQGFNASASAFVFPLCYFLVAVPWPTLIEGPIIQGLSRANASSAVELLGWLGLPALRRGNVIEITTGIVGINEACSGIRSFQATLMISLFLGEMGRFTLGRRVALCFSGFAMAFLFNLARTSLLVWVAWRRGLSAVSHWHDPAGVTILVACFLGLWAMSVVLGRRKEERAGSGAKGHEQQPMGTAPASTLESVQPPASHPPAAPSLSTAAWRCARGAFLGLAIWLIFTEVSVELWYRAHERRLPTTSSWTVRWPRENATFRESAPSEEARQLLRYDEGGSAAWEERDGKRWQAVFLRWQPGRIAVHLAKGHTPATCLRAAGMNLRSTSELKWYSVQGLNLPYRIYVVKDMENGLPMHVLYCLWEDRSEDRNFAPTSLTYANRLAPVLAGRRNLGQRSLELVAWGFPDDTQAERALLSQLDKLIQIEKE